MTGNVDAALENLQQGLRSWLVFDKIDPDFDFIRDDPRFRELVGLDKA